MNRREEKRLELHEVLCDILGTRHAYFQPPESLKLEYPAIVYHLATIKTDMADNRVYNKTPKYTLTLLDKDSTSELVERIIERFACRVSAVYKSNNLSCFKFEIDENSI